MDNKSPSPFDWGFGAALGAVAASLVVGAVTAGGVLVISAIDGAMERRKEKKAQKAMAKEAASGS